MNRSFTCLLIEDDADDQQIFISALSEAFPRAKCWIAENCRQALDRMHKRLAPIPDYIFMDWNLPAVNGMECILKIRDSGINNASLFIISGSFPPASPEELLQMGIRSVVSKQNSIPDLVAELHHVINTF
jgi:CheY-like chemotaxis protein